MSRRVLMLCTKFSSDPANGWLTGELAAALDAQACAVDIIHLDWQAEGAASFSPIYQQSRVLHFPALGALPRWLPKPLRTLSKWLGVSYIAAARARNILPLEPYDLLIGFSPALSLVGLARSYGRRAKKKILIYWDFFPRHYVEAGVLPAGRAIEPLAYAIENNAVADYQVAGCMSPANMDYFKRYFTAFRGTIEWLPVWGPPSLIDRSAREAARARFGFAAGDVVCVFGGQLIRGRGVEAICDLADRVATALPQVKFVIAGSGLLEPMVRARAEASATKNLRYLGQLTRTDYEALLAAGDVGLVFTPNTVSVPTFPSKTVDYLRAQIPILAAVEAAGDYPHILENEMGAGFGCVAGDAGCLIEKLSRLANDAALRASCGARGAAYYQTHMTAPVIAAKILSWSAA